jgi:hypothetical protein
LAILEKTMSLDTARETLRELSKRISEQQGKGGNIDTPERAIQKLFLGDPSKKAGDQSEAEELLEELTKEPVWLPGLASEVADWAYYSAKIPTMPGDLETQFLGACGFTQEGAIGAAYVKYGARLGLNIVGDGAKEDRHAFENGNLKDWLFVAQRTGMVDPSRINADAARETLGQIKEALHV